jgi:hypothetical protein
MTIDFTAQEFQMLVKIINRMPEWTTARDRRRLIANTFEGTPYIDSILGRIDFEGTPIGSVTETIRVLKHFGQVTAGREALGVFLEQLLINTMGLSDEADFLADFIEKHNLIASPKSSPTISQSLSNSTPKAATSNSYIFISYARPEQSIAETIEGYLLKSGFRVFRDVRNIPVGENWDTKIEDALRETEYMILLLSASSMPYRKEVHREWFYFDQNRKRILPILVQECTLHSRMLSYNYVDGRTNLLSAIEQIVTKLNEKI